MLYQYPNLEIQNANLSIKVRFDKNRTVKILKFILKLINIYNYENFKTNKIILNNSKIKY